MGWSSGSELACDLIHAYEKSATSVPDETKKQFYRELIKSFEAHDCDTLQECLGIGSEFDAVLLEAFKLEDEEYGWAANAADASYAAAHEGS